MTVTEETGDRVPETFTEGDPLQPNGVQENVKQKRTCWENCKNVFSNITVEPTMALFVLAAIVGNLTSQNLALEKACRVNLNFSREICDSLRLQEAESQNEYEREVQRLIARFIAYKTYITATVPSLLALFAGAYSDKTGRRKVFLIYSLCGQILAGVNNMINAYFFYELGLEYLTFSEAVFEGLSGGWTLPFFIMFAFISTITTEKNRTFRMGMLNFALTVGFPIGMGLSGFFIKNFGYYGGYGLVLAGHFVNLMYNSFVLKESPRTTEQKKHNNRGFLYFLRTFFSFANIKESFRVMFRYGPNNRRARLIVYMIVVSILFGPMYGEISVLYLGVRYRFSWDELQFSIFQTYNFITHTIGTMFSIVVFSKYLGWHDSLLGIISTISKIASSFVYCFAANGWIFAIGPLVEILNGTSMLAMRSLISKIVEVDELGKVNSIISLTENLMPLIYVPLYTNVYKATMETLPGAVFLVGSAMTVPAVAVFVYLFYEHRKGIGSKEKEAQAAKNLMQPN